mmetsp:Transcript_115615/g.332002  ORF Transcript_115615/g.332002 Transcript_115615/m.332002 type:complete len:241 (+) Transcript_115615:767-1489(+)
MIVSGFWPAQSARKTMPAAQTWSLGPVGVPSMTSGGCHNGSPIPHGSGCFDLLGLLQSSSATSSLATQARPNPDTSTSPFEYKMFSVDNAPWTKPASSRSLALRSTLTKMGKLSSSGMTKGWMDFRHNPAPNSSAKEEVASPDSETMITASLSTWVSKYWGSLPDSCRPLLRQSIRRLATAASRTASSFRRISLTQIGKWEGLGTSVAKRWPALSILRKLAPLSLALMAGGSAKCKRVVS